MQTSVDTARPRAQSSTAPELPLWSLALIFWAAFAIGIAAVRMLNPEMFERQDPDSLMRLAGVRDLIGGQGWFDLVQHRLDPPAGLLMHWSRLIDAPLAGLALIGGLFGDGEAFALAVWPLLVLLGFQISLAYVATALGGRPAAVPALILSLLFFTPLLSFLPGSIDHHNAQLALMMAALATAMRLPAGPACGLAAGFACALMLAIGLEMLPYVAVIGMFVAAQWGLTARGEAGTAAFGIAFGASPAALYLLTGSPVASMACDSLSWAYALPAGFAGFGLAALTVLVDRRDDMTFRLLCLFGLGLATAAVFLAVSPACLTGPYGFLSPELKALWLDNITEAQPVFVYSAREPVGIIAILGPPIVAFAVAARRAWRAPGQAAVPWLWPAALILTALALSFYQVRTLPYANAVAIPVLGAWIAAEAARRGAASDRLAGRALPVVVAFLLAMPLVHLAFGWSAVRGIALATEGRVAPAERPDISPAVAASLSAAEKDCIDPTSRALLEEVPPGLVMAPVFYGSSVLALSQHAVVAAPYHRAGPAILNAIRTMRLPPAEAVGALRQHDVSYVAICSTSRETARGARDAPDGLLARLLAGESVAGLDPVAAKQATTLRLWRIGTPTYRGPDTTG